MSYSQVLEYDTYILVNDGKKTTSKSVLVQVNSPEELWISKIYIRYNASDEVKSLKAEIFDNKGNVVRKLKNKEIETKAYISDGTFFEDDLYKEFDLTYNVFPYTFRYSYETVNDNFNYLSGWTPIYRTTVKTINANLTIDLPESYKYNIHIRDVSEKKEELTNERRILTFKSSYLIRIGEESYSAPLQEHYPHVLTIPETFYYGVEGNSSSWKSYGDWHVKLNEGLDYLTSSEKTKIDKIIEQSSDTLEMVRNLYYHLQDHTRYINVAIDIGGLKPYSAAYVCTNKYGDCKALTIYMKALLKYAGINSYYTVINAGDHAERIIEEFPFQQFNHVVLTVPFKGDTLWLENTSDYLPFAYNGTFTQNRKALTVGLKESKLVNSPALSLKEVHNIRKVLFDIDDLGNGILQIDAILRGDAFENYRYLKQQATTKTFNSQVAKDFRVKDSELLNYNVVNFDRDAFDLNLKVSLKVENQIRLLGSIRVITPYKLELPELEKPMFRKNPLLVRHPLNKEYIIKYKVNSEKSGNVELPQDILIETKFGFYKQRNSYSNGEITVAKHFQLYSGECPLKEYQEFYDFFESVNKAQKESIILDNKL
ncbi:transglutaminase domain-containing protein [Fulvivirga sp.]|uniref:transglutaminase domain-containing protein n=1 Tax=Fulvivirga sp. TaxID=1931237 RepID=UPI0032EF33B8